MKQSQELVTPNPRYSIQSSLPNQPFYFSETKNPVEWMRTENTLRQNNKIIFRRAASVLKKNEIWGIIYGRKSTLNKKLVNMKGV
jgi:hypothetical protein